MASSIKINEVKLGDIISLNIYGVGLNNIVSAEVVAFTTGKYLSNKPAAALNHANIYPTIADNANIPDNYQAYDYIQLKRVDGDVIEIGKPWIIPLSVTRQERVTALVAIPDFDNNDIVRLKSVLANAGWSESIITLSE